MKKIKQRKGTWRGSWGSHFKQGSQGVRGMASAQKPMGNKGVCTRSGSRHVMPILSSSSRPTT